MDIAYIYSHDGDGYGLKFGVTLCNEGTLFRTVRLHLDPNGTDEAFPSLYEVLVEQGSYDFEDGWVVIKRGAQEIADFLIYQLRDAKAEERFSDEQRAKEFQARQETEAKYQQLREALVTALGPNAPAVTKAAA